MDAGADMVFAGFTDVMVALDEKRGWYRNNRDVLTHSERKALARFVDQAHHMMDGIHAELMQFLDKSTDWSDSCTDNDESDYEDDDDDGDDPNESE